MTPRPMTPKWTRVSAQDAGIGPGAEGGHAGRDRRRFHEIATGIVHFSAHGETSFWLPKPIFPRGTRSGASA